LLERKPLTTAEHGDLTNCTVRLLCRKIWGRGQSGQANDGLRPHHCFCHYFIQ